MSEWHPLPYKNYKWIVADPALLGGKLAVRGTRFSVSFLLSCLAEGMTAKEIQETYAPFPPEAVPQIIKSRQSCSTCLMWLLDANMPAKLSLLLEEFSIEATTAQSQGWGARAMASLWKLRLRPVFRAS
jgi:uncharacterized protein (DUF433 family)